MADILIYLWQTVSNNKRINTESNPNMAILSEGRQIIKLSYIASPHPSIKCHQTAKCANNVWQIHTSPTNVFCKSWFFNILRCPRCLLSPLLQLMVLCVSMYPGLWSIGVQLHSALTGSYIPGHHSVILVNSPNEQAAKDIGRCSVCASSYRAYLCFFYSFMNPLC